MLLQEGFEVVSSDASDKMLKYAFKERWNRRKEDAFDKWIIEEANWLHIYDDIKHVVGDGFDAVICLGNSFAHMMDSFGDQREQKQAIKNFEKCLKPGGILLIDHRNYDNILETGSTPSKSLYYNVGIFVGPIFLFFILFSSNSLLTHQRLRLLCCFTVENLL